MESEPYMRAVRRALEIDPVVYLHKLLLCDTAVFLSSSFHLQQNFAVLVFFTARRYVVPQIRPAGRPCARYK